MNIHAAGFILTTIHPTNVIPALLLLLQSITTCIMQPVACRILIDQETEKRFPSHQPDKLNTLDFM
jgi:hypothetical protein